MGCSSVLFPPLPQCLMKFIPCFSSFGSLEELFCVFVPMSATSWELRGGPYSSLSHDYSCWDFSGSKSGQPYLLGPGGGLCVKFNIVPVFMVVSVLVYPLVVFVQYGLACT